MLAKVGFLLSISRSTIPRDNFNTLTATPKRIGLLAKELAQKLRLLAALFAFRPAGFDHAKLVAEKIERFFEVLYTHHSV